MNSVQASAAAAAAVSLATLNALNSIGTSMSSSCSFASIDSKSLLSQQRQKLFGETSSSAGTSSGHTSVRQHLQQQQQQQSTSTSSPLVMSNARNAGRKKTNPVWDFFTDLKPRGLPGVRCRYCEWITNDRSPTTLKFHLKRKHDTGPGGIWSIVEERIVLHSMHNIKSRTLANTSINGENGGVGTLDMSQINVASQSILDGSNNNSSSAENCFAAAARAVFEATPSSSQQSVLDQLIRNATANAASSSFDAENVFDTVNSGVDGICGLKSSTTSQGIADYEENGSESSYHLSDGQNIAELLQVAADMDLTFTFNSRRTCEYCFESNTPQMKGRMIVFSDLGDKVGVAERFNGVERGSEQWRKADWKQFLWAVRGKCMNALKGV